MLKLKSLLIVSLLCNASLSIQSYSQSLQDRMDNAIPLLMEQNNVPGLAIAIIENNEIILKKGFGFADIENSIPVIPNTGFNIGSVSKTFSAWGIMKLVESGKVDLDEPIENYLSRWKIPESEFDRTKVTIRNILSHTAGLSVHGYPGFPPEMELPTLEQSLNGENGPVRKSESVKLIHEPNTKFKYSGGGFTILQLVIEEVTGKSFSDYMEETIFAPLKMEHTSFTISSDILESSATPYDEKGKEIYLEQFTAQAAAGLHTTLNDFIRFAHANLQENDILSESTLSMMMEPVPVTDNMYGLSYRLMKAGSFTLAGHAGSNDGWESAFFLHPQSNSGIVMLSNGSLGKNVLISTLRNWIAWKASQEAE